jgi:hypothetical protein
VNSTTIEPNPPGVTGASTSAGVSAPGRWLSGRASGFVTKARLLVVARAFWVVTALFSLGLFAASVPARYGQLAEPSSDLQSGLAQLDISARFYATYLVAVEIVFAAVFLIISLIIFLRKYRDWVALFLSYMLLLFGMASHPIVHTMEALAATQLFWMPPVRFLTYLTWLSVFLFFFLFPDGKFVPRWTRWFIIFHAMLLIPWDLFPDSPYSPWMWEPVPLLIVEFVTWGTCVYAQVYRYIHTSDRVQRQQTKWVMLGGIASILGNLVFYLPRYIDPSLKDVSLGSSLLYQMVSITAMYLFSLLTPLAIAISILRYRLWDINLLINRTLVYIPLTGIIGGLYSASVVLFQKVFVALIGETSDAAIVLSTLILASTFTPMKNALQTLVDKRFKESSDPTRDLDLFGERVRSVIEVNDPHAVASRLLDEAICAFGARSGAIFLDGDGERGPFYTYGEWRDEESQVEVPLQHEGDHLGVLQLGVRQDGSAYSAADFEKLRSNAEVVARAIEVAACSLYPGTHTHPERVASTIHALPE